MAANKRFESIGAGLWCGCFVCTVTLLPLLILHPTNSYSKCYTSASFKHDPSNIPLHLCSWGLIAVASSRSPSAGSDSDVPSAQTTASQGTTATHGRPHLSSGSWCSSSGMDGGFDGADTEHPELVGSWGWQVFREEGRANRGR
jgi:hypothetical protein